MGGIPCGVANAMVIFPREFTVTSPNRKQLFDDSKVAGLVFSLGDNERRVAKPTKDFGAPMSQQKLACIEPIFSSTSVDNKIGTMNSVSCTS